MVKGGLGLNFYLLYIYLINQNLYANESFRPPKFGPPSFELF